jgi:hypothetical protein
MADSRSRKTGEHNAQLVGLMADAVAMRAQIAALEERVARLEAEAAATRGSARASKRPPAGPPPLPPPPKAFSGAMPAFPRTPSIPSALPGPSAGSKPGARRSVVDISEIAELVESIPPPIPRPKK